MLIVLLTGAREPVLVPAVSQQKIDIVYSFTGAELLLFGAILYPDGPDSDAKADIAVVVRGPTTPLVVRQKEKLLGLIWANTESTRFQSAPGFYAVASSKPLETLIDERTAAIYELGLGNIQLSPADAGDPAKLNRFEAGFVNLRQRTALFSTSPGSVTITQGALYQARIYLPARVPTGMYTAETFLIKNGRVLAVATRDVEIRKSGFERFVAESAVDWPVLYGSFAILLSLGMGFAASALFRRL